MVSHEVVDRNVEHTRLVEAHQGLVPSLELIRLVHIAQSKADGQIGRENETKKGCSQGRNVFGIDRESGRSVWQCSLVVVHSPVPVP